MENLVCISIDEQYKHIGKFDGFLPASDDTLDVFTKKLLNGEIGFLKERTDLLEGNNLIKQLITYVLVSDGHGNFIVYQRPSKNNEKRLAGNYTVGFGGHINEDDFRTGDDFIYTAAFRELREETGSDINLDEDRLNFLGFLYTDDNAVSRVHQGCVFVYNCADPYEFNQFFDTVENSEVRNIINVPYNNIPDDINENFELWSKIVMKSINEITLVFYESLGIAVGEYIGG